MNLSKQIAVAWQGYHRRADPRWLAQRVASAWSKWRWERLVRAAKPLALSSMIGRCGPREFELNSEGHIIGIRASNMPHEVLLRSVRCGDGPELLPEGGIDLSWFNTAGGFSPFDFGYCGQSQPLRLLFEPLSTHAFLDIVLAFVPAADLKSPSWFPKRPPALRPGEIWSCA
jgi:hypothetical protein